MVLSGLKKADTSEYLTTEDRMAIQSRGLLPEREAIFCISINQHPYVSYVQEVGKKHNLRVPWGVVLYDNSYVRQDISTGVSGGGPLEDIDLNNLEKSVLEMSHDLMQTRFIFFYEDQRDLLERIRGVFEEKNPGYAFVEIK